MTAIDESQVLNNIRNLVKIPSYLGQEEEKANWMAEKLDRMGLKVTEIPLPTDDSHQRRNVLGKIETEGKNPTLFCCAHLDTHWPQKNQLYPHKGVMKDGKIYGVGSGDSHGPLAAFLGAIDAIQKSNLELEGDLIFGATVDELGHKLGAKAIADSSLKADMCIMGDAGYPLKIWGYHTGKIEVEIRTRGESGFLTEATSERMFKKSSNAVVSMNKIMNYLSNMVEEETYFHQTDPHFPGEGAGYYTGPIMGGSVGYGLPTMEPGKNKGQHGLASPPPTWCKLRVGARYWPGQTPEEFLNLIKKWVNKAKEKDPSIEAEVVQYLDEGNTPWECDPASKVVTTLKESVETVHEQEAQLIGYTNSLELPFYQRAGMECIGYGASFRVGSKNEHITVKELMDMCRVFTLSIAKLLCE